MSKFTFIREQSNFYGNNCKQVVEFSAETLDDILTEFEFFLKGAGFYFEGNVIIDQETWPVDEANIKLDEYRLSEQEDAN